MPVVDRPGPAGSSNWDCGVKTDVFVVLTVVIVTLMALMVAQSGELNNESGGGDRAACHGFECERETTQQFKMNNYLEMI